MLEVRGLSLRYPNGTEALAGFDVSVAAGELVIVLGGNGSGKTTLLRCITRTLSPSAGEVRVNGVDLTRLSGEKLRRARLDLALISQLAALVRRRSVLTNVATGALGRHATLWTALGGLPAEELAAAGGYLAEVGLAPLARQRAGTLSGGQAQRVAIARALAVDPPLLLLDEPTASLDPARRNDLGEALTALARSGRALVMTSHDDDFVREFATRVVVLANGEVVEEGDPRTVLTAPSHPATRELLQVEREKKRR